MPAFFMLKREVNFGLSGQGFDLLHQAFANLHSKIAVIIM